MVGEYINLFERPVIRFWGRKSPTLCLSLINKYSSFDDIVLDCFGGSGSIIQAAILSKRRGIYIDANPYAWFITYVLLEGVSDISKYLEAVSKICNRRRVYYILNGKKCWILKEKLYQARCPICGELEEVKYYKWSKGDCCAILTCGHTIRSNDFVGTTLARYLYPRKAPLYYENGTPFDKRRNVNYIHELFTSRNLLLLSTLLYDIDNISKQYPSDIALALYFTFVAILFNSSKMARNGAGSWGVPCYWIPPTHIEKDPYRLFKNKARLLANYFTKLNKLKNELDYKVSTDIKDVLNGKCELAITIGNTLDLKDIPDESIDLVFTDPPHTDEIQYFELSYFYWSWLISSRRFNNLIKKILGFKPKLDFNIEICINLKRNKTLNIYLDELHKSFNEIYRVLKENRYAILFFHEEDSRVKAEIIRRMREKFIIKENLKVLMKQRAIGERNPEGKNLDIFILLKRE